MMLYKLSLKNIRKSFKDYLIYFFTLILGVAIFYVFNALDSQTVLLNVTSSTYDIIELMINILSGVSVFVSFVLGFLIIYASRFLIKRRNKEFGIYLTLGMSKRKISAILFFETLFIGIISLIIGILLGISLSQFMSILVANLFDADMTKFQFVFSSSACIKTLIYFGIMYVLVMIFNTISISKCKLIDLLYGNKRSEKIKFKNPYLCIAVFIVSVIVLAKAYYMVTTGFTELESFQDIFIPIIMGSVSTFFIFWSLSGLILKLVLSIKSVYFKGLNSFVLRQFSSKINTMVWSMSIICLMLFFTICILSSSLSMKNSMTANLDELAPVDLGIMKRVDYDITEVDEGKSLETLNSSVKDSLNALGFDTLEYLSDYVDVNFYSLENLTLKDTFGDKIDEILKQYRFLNFTTREDIMKVEDYNRVAKVYGLEEYSLEDDEYMIIADFDSFVKIRNEALREGVTINIYDRTLKPKYQECKNGFVEMSSNHINSGIILVNGNIVDEESISKNLFLGNYRGKSKDEKRNIENKLTDISTKAQYKDYGTLNFSTRLTIAEASTGLGALVTFIGLYLGIIFLISSAAILALKELSESADNKERFMMIRKLGADEKLIRNALFRQIGIFFATPLILAIIHSIFGIKFCTNILESFGTKGLIPSIIMTTVFLLFIYGGYFILTFESSKNIIKSKSR